MEENIQEGIEEVQSDEQKEVFIGEMSYRVDARVFSNLLDIVHSMCEEVPFEFTPKSWFLKIVDPAHIQMAIITVSSNALNGHYTLRKTYRGDGSPIKATFLITGILNYVKRLCSSRKFTGNKINVVVHHTDRDTSLIVKSNCDEKTFSAIDVDYFVPTTPDLKHSVRIDGISQPVFKRAVNECSFITDFFEVRTSVENGSSSSSISVSNDRNEQYNCPIGTPEFLGDFKECIESEPKLEKYDDVDSKYAADVYSRIVSKIVDPLRPSAPMTFSLTYGKDYPSVIDWKIHGIDFRVLTAPRVET